MFFPLALVVEGDRQNTIVVRRHRLQASGWNSHNTYTYGDICVMMMNEKRYFRYDMVTSPLELLHVEGIGLSRTSNR